MRVLRGKPNHSTQYLSTVEVPEAVEGSIDAFLDQTHTQIFVTSAFGSMLFHRDDKQAVVDGLISLAQFIERNVIL